MLGDDLKYHVKSPKTFYSDRIVKLPSFVVEAIKKQGYIANVNPNTITKEFIDLQKNNGLKQFRFHDLRHYSASIRHALNIPDAYIMQEGGWSSDSTLKSVYRHALDDEQDKMADIAIKYFEAI